MARAMVVITFDCVQSLPLEIEPTPTRQHGIACSWVCGRTFPMISSETLARTSRLADERFLISSYIHQSRLGWGVARRLQLGSLQSSPNKRSESFHLYSREGYSCMPIGLPISSCPTDYQISMHSFLGDSSRTFPPFHCIGGGKRWCSVS